MPEFVGVISSTGLPDDSGTPVSEKVCPRELLGLACVASQYVCLCQQVEGCSVETVKNEHAGTAIVNLRLEGVSDAQAVMASLDLTGYKADLQVSRREIVAAFNMRRPQNAGLRSPLLDVFRRGLG